MALGPPGYFVEFQPDGNTEMPKVGKQVGDVGLVIRLPAVTGRAGVMPHGLLRAHGPLGIALFGIVGHGVTLNK